jgi:hypothetical protein
MAEDNEPSPSLGVHRIWATYCTTEQLSFQLVRFDETAFSTILELRHSVYENGELAHADSFDPYSEHYLAIIRGAPVAAMRVTRKVVGPIECEEYVPESLLRIKGSVICSACRFVALPSVQASTRVAEVLTEVVRMHQAKLGTRLDVINVHERAVKYYGRLGYVLVADSFFWHPKWNTPSHIMVLPVTPNREVKMRHVFEDVIDPLEMDELETLVRFQPWQEFQRRPTKERKHESAATDIGGSGNE